MRPTGTDPAERWLQSTIKRPFLILGLLIALIVGFLLFRPDKLFADDPVNESLAAAFVTTTTAIPPVTTGSITPTTNPPSAVTSTTGGPTSLGTGKFTGIDHRAAGTATIYEDDGMFVLRFEEDTDIQNGPDLYVWVLEGSDYQSGTTAGYLDLGKLKGNVGGQNYQLPADFDPVVHRGVLIWCLRFAVPFAFAPLT